MMGNAKPQGATALIEAVRWVEGLLLGSFGVAISVLAVGFFGYAMLTGRASLRTGSRVALGAFVLFSAPVIANGLVGLVEGENGSIEIPVSNDQPPPIAPVPIPPAADPYAGAAVPG